MMKNVRENKVLIMVLNILFIISCPFFTLLFINNLAAALFHVVISYDYITINIILSFIIGIFIAFKFNIIKKVIDKITYKSLIVTIAVSICFLMNYALLEKHNVYYILNIFKDFFNIEISFFIGLIILSIMALPAIIIFLNYFIQLVLPITKKFFIELSKTEKIYLIIVSIIAVIVTVGIYTNTRLFYNPGKNDVLFTTDSYFISATRANFNVNSAENDVRQPLFGVAGLPFSTISKIIGSLLFFIPNLEMIIYNLSQIFLLGISFLLISRMLKLTGKNQIVFLILLFATFPSIIYSFIIEQYIFSLFYLILTIYIWYSSYEKVNYTYVMATGTMLTSGIFFPLISKAKKFKDFAFDIFKCFIAFVVVFIMFGRIPILVNLSERTESLLEFSGAKVEITDRLLQYSNFLSSTMYAPESHEEESQVNGFIDYRLDVTTNVNILGIIILILAILGFIVNRKNKLCIISILWIAFSFAILGIFGWGTQENGLVLYTLYFSWAFIVLIFSLIEKLFSKISKLKYTLLVSLIISMLIINIPAFIEIINFGIKYYPTIM